MTYSAETKFWWSSAAICAAAMGALYYAGQRHHSAALALTEARQSQAALEDRVRRALNGTTAENDPARLVTPTRRVSSADYDPQQTVSPSSARAQTLKAEVTLSVLKLPWRDLVLRDDGSLQSKYLRVEANAVEQLYAGFLAKHAATSEQTSRFTSAMADYQEKLIDLKATASAQGLSEGDPAIVELTERAAQQLATVQQTLFGDRGIEDLRLFERAAPTREFIDGFAGTMALTASPLSPEQADQLTQLLSDRNSSYRAGKKADNPGIADAISSATLSSSVVFEAFDADDVLAAAKGLLTTEQFAAFEAKVTANHKLAQFYNLMVTSSEKPVTGFAFGRR